MALRPPGDTTTVQLLHTDVTAPVQRVTRCSALSDVATKVLIRANVFAMCHGAGLLILGLKSYRSVVRLKQTRPAVFHVSSSV